MDEKYMGMAYAQAQRAADLGEVPVGAIVVQNGGVIGVGHNRPIASHDPCAHAEIMALRDAGKTVGNYRLVGATLFVTLEPCLMCAGALVHSRIERLVFGAREPKAGAIVSQASSLEAEFLNHRVEVVEGVLAERCSNQLSEFFRRRRQSRKA